MVKASALALVCIAALPRMVGAQPGGRGPGHSQTDGPFSGVPTIVDRNARPFARAVGPFESEWPAAIAAPRHAAAETKESIAKKPIEKGFNGDPQQHFSRPGDGPAAPIVPREAHRNTGFVDLNYYWDTREFTVFTFNAGAKLPHDFEYFQFLNAFSPFDSNSTDWQAFYTEVNLRRPIWKDHELLKPLDWTVQYADGTFPTGVLRAGVRWRLHDTPGDFGRFFNDVLKLRLGISFHILETDGTGWQMEYAYRRDFFDKRLYIGGFADHNIDGGGNSTWVTEHQIGLRLFDQWHAVAEYRYSSFDPRQFRSGWGIGLEYVIRFK